MVDRLKRLSLYIFLGLLAYMPLHILLSTWIGTSFDALPAAKVAKDVVLIFGFLLALTFSIRAPWFRQLLHNKLIWLISAYGLLTVLLAIIRPTDPDAEILGVVYNTRFLVFFLYGLMLSRLFDAQIIRRQAVRTVLMVGTAVLFFGIVQYTLLPNDALTHVGYSRSNGVLPAFFIDDKPDLERVMSTLRDPNSFGSYIIIIGALAAAFWLKSKNREVKKISSGLLALSVLSLWFTFSRSAWLGFVLSTCLVVGLSLDQKIKSSHAKKIPLFGLGLCIIIIAAIYPLRNTYFVQNVIFHADESTSLEDPNELRTRFYRESIKDVVANPIGHGPGTAGLASIRNEKQGVKLNESYYLQIAYEVGLVGLGLFLAILILCGVHLFRLAPNSNMGLGLLASLAGLCLTNLLVHIWSNEAVAYTWWGLAGIYYSYLSQRRT